MKTLKDKKTISVSIVDKNKPAPKGKMKIKSRTDGIVSIVSRTKKQFEICVLINCPQKHLQAVLEVVDKEISKLVASISNKIKVEAVYARDNLEITFNWNDVEKQYGKNNK